MSDYLGALLSRSMEPEMAVRPRPLLRFEPLASGVWGTKSATEEPWLAVEEVQRPAAAPPGDPAAPPPPPAPLSPEAPKTAPLSETRQTPRRIVSPQVQTDVMSPFARHDMPRETQLVQSTPQASPATPVAGRLLDLTPVSPPAAPAARRQQEAVPVSPPATPTGAPPPTIVREIVRELQLQPQETIVEREVVIVQRQTRTNWLENGSGEVGDRRSPLPAPPPTTVPQIERRYEQPRAAATQPAPAHISPGSSPAPVEKQAHRPQSLVTTVVTRRRAEAQLPVPMGLEPRPAPAQQAPTINVSIGRVEVRASQKPAPQPPKTARPRPRTADSSLADYLKQRANGEYR